MSKIICDVCGTSYPETATQCPICGCVRPGDAHPVDSDTNQKDSVRVNSYVKGGRFSKSNVRKRTRTTQAAAKAAAASQVKKPENGKDKGNKGLVITAVILLLAIITVVIYIAVRFFLPEILPSGTETTNSAANSTTGPDETTLGEVLCTDLTLDVTEIVFGAANESRMLYVTVSPADTTETVAYSSSDESIATVSAEGKITAIAPGTATITVTCGSQTETCTVECAFTDPTEDTTIPETDETTAPTTVPVDNSFKLNRMDITFSRKGDSWVIYDGNVSMSNITWTTDDETIATIENGKVVAVGSGVTKVHGEYNGEKASCIIRCSFAQENTGVTGSGGGVSEDVGSNGTGGSTGGYKVYSGYGGEVFDVTIAVGESFTLHLKNTAGEYVSVIWAAANTEICTVSDNSVSGVSAGVTTVSATHEGVTYSCTVRVH